MTSESRVWRIEVGQWRYVQQIRVVVFAVADWKRDGHEVSRPWAETVSPYKMMSTGAIC